MCARWRSGTDVLALTLVQRAPGVQGRAARRKARELELLRSTHWPQAAAVLQHHVRCWLARRQLQRLAQAESNVVGSAGYGAAAACIQSSAADAERCGSGAAAEAATRTIALPPQARGFDRPATKLRGAKPPAGPDQLVKPAWRPSAQHPQRGEAAGGARQHAEAGDAASATGRAAAAGTLRAAPTQHQQAVGVAGDQRTQRQAAQLPPASPSPAKGPSALPVAPSRPLLRSSQTSSKPLQQVRRTPQQPRGSATGGSSVRSSDAGSSSSTAVSDDELFVGSAVRPLHEQALRVRRREHAQLVQQTAPNKAAPGVNK